MTRLFTTEGSPIKASMLRDIERGSVTEGEHVLGELTARAHAHGVANPSWISHASMSPRTRPFARVNRLRQYPMVTTSPPWIEGCRWRRC